MGHGYFTVLGYGFIFTIEDFVAAFGDSDLEEEETDFSEIEKELPKLEKKYKISFHSEEQGERRNIFVTTKNAIVHDVSVAEGEFDMIKLRELKEDTEGLEKFALKFLASMINLGSSCILTKGPKTLSLFIVVDK